ncbi:MAG: hypothetical protein MZV63_61010 [Marinilabiliales bacterium]|nr:hypothetical protein [Marinilabiliales bacterium]
MIRLRRASKPGITRVDEKLFRFEKTTELVTSGIYRYIRHPMYSSLLLLAWGIWLKQPLAATLPVVAACIMAAVAHSQARRAGVPGISATVTGNT